MTAETITIGVVVLVVVGYFLLDWRASSRLKARIAGGARVPNRMDPTAPPVPHQHHVVAQPPDGVGNTYGSGSL